MGAIQVVVYVASYYVRAMARIDHYDMNRWQRLIALLFAAFALV